MELRSGRLMKTSPRLLPKLLQGIRSRNGSPLFVLATNNGFDWSISFSLLYDSKFVCERPCNSPFWIRFTMHCGTSIITNQPSSTRLLKHLCYKWSLSLLFQRSITACVSIYRVRWLFQGNTFSLIIKLCMALQRHLDNVLVIVPWQIASASRWHHFFRLVIITGTGQGIIKKVYLRELGTKKSTWPMVCVEWLSNSHSTNI